MGRIFRIIFLSLTILGVLAGILGYWYLQTIGAFSLSKQQLTPIKNHRFQSNTQVYDRQGTQIGEFYDTYHLYVPIDKMPSTVIEAVVSVEDRNFWAHFGVDPKGILRAALARLRHGKITQGASTITQQVVRHFLLTNEKTMQRKILEIIWAVKLEKILTKEQILEIYLNSLFLGNGAYGVGAAAQRYFDKSVEDLTVAEASLIAGLYQSPSRYNPMRYPQKARKRQREVLKAMLRAGYLTAYEAKAARQEKLVYRQRQAQPSMFAGNFLDYVKEEAKAVLGPKYKHLDGKGLKIFATLDSNLQRKAMDSLAYNNSLLEQSERRILARPTMNYATTQNQAARGLEAALLSTDPQTGEILTMVGGRNFQKSQYNRTTSSKRSPGSAFKPIIYSLALMRGFRWSDVIYVSPVNIENYRPKNFTDDYLTETTMMRAFYRSMNTPTVEIAQKLGLRSILDQAKRLGIRSNLKEEFGSTLGSSDVTMLDLARVYGVFANEGRLTELTSIQRIESYDGEVLYTAPAVSNRTSVPLTPQIAFLMTHGMKAVMTTGTAAKSHDLAEFAVGKTGTSNDSTDNWFCGYTRNMVTIVWVGTDDHSPIGGGVTGGSLALPIWDYYVRFSQDKRPAAPFAPPPGVTSAYVHAQYGYPDANGMRMYFLPEFPLRTDGNGLKATDQYPVGAYRNVFNH